MIDTSTLILIGAACAGLIFTVYARIREMKALKDSFEKHQANLAAKSLPNPNVVGGHTHSIPVHSHHIIPPMRPPPPPRNMHQHVVAANIQPGNILDNLTPNEYIELVNVLTTRLMKNEKFVEEIRQVAAKVYQEAREKYDDIL